MSEDRERAVQDWFNSSAQEVPHQPFTLEVVEKIERRERFRRLQRHAAALVAFFAICLLLPELLVPANMLAALPVTVIAASGRYWPVLVLPAAGLVFWLVNRVRGRDLLRRG